MCVNYMLQDKTETDITSFSSSSMGLRSEQACSFGIQRLNRLVTQMPCGHFSPPYTLRTTINDFTQRGGLIELNCSLKAHVQRFR